MKNEDYICSVPNCEVLNCYHSIPHSHREGCIYHCLKTVRRDLSNNRFPMICIPVTEAITRKLQGQEYE